MTKHAFFLFFSCFSLTLPLNSLEGYLLLSPNNFAKIEGKIAFKSAVRIQF